MSRAERIIHEDAEVMNATIPDVFAQLSGSNILITGASGFLGSFIVDILSALNHSSPSLNANIVAADNFIATNADRLSHLKDDPFIEFRTANVVDRTDWGRRFDWIIHCASMASPVYYRPRPLERIDANVNGTWRMLDLAEEHRARGVLYFSSGEIYGDPDPQFIPTPEHYRGYVSCTGPRACYDESKRLGETLCISFWAQRKVPCKIVRPFNVYGPGQRLNDGRMVPDMMSAALRGGPIVLLSDGTPTRSFCYVRDFITGSLGVLVKGKPAEPYNVGNPEERSMLDVARMMAEIAGRLMRGVHLDKCWGVPGRAGKPQLAGAVAYLRAGIGFGGSCFPKDLRALREFARKEGIEVPILNSVLKVNQERAGRVVDSLTNHLGAVRGKRIAVLGLAFKPETDDVRESPGVRIAKVLSLRGADVVVHDPLVRFGAVRDELGPGTTQVDDVTAAATRADAIVIATGWDAYRKLDWTDIAQRMRSPVIFDGRQVVCDQLPTGVTLLATGRRTERVGARPSRSEVRMRASEPAPLRGRLT